MSASAVAEVEGPSLAPATETQEPARMSIAASLTIIGAATLFTMIARRVATKQAEPTDEEVAEVAEEHQSDVIDTLIKPVTVLSMPTVVVPATAALAWWLYRKDRKAASLVVALTPVAAAAIGQSFTMLFPQKNPPDKADNTAEKPEASFPSGHTTGVTAEALAVAYILAAEEMSSFRIRVLLILWPLLVGISRVYRRRHWLSDVLAGWTAGTGIAAGSVLAYALMRSDVPTTRRSS